MVAEFALTLKWTKLDHKITESEMVSEYWLEVLKTHAENLVLRSLHRIADSICMQQWW